MPFLYHKMEKFWKAALGVAGIGAIGLFVFYGLYKKWLSLPIFEKLSQDQTFYVMCGFLALVFAVAIFAIIAWLRHSPAGETSDAALHRLEQSWSGVNYIDCDNLVGPDVNRAANALSMTAQYWRKGFLDKRLIAEQYGKVFVEIYEELNRCDMQVPGYNKPKKFCKDFLSPLVKSAYSEIKNHAHTK